MTVTDHSSPRGGHEPGPKYFIDIEGTDYEWDRSTITVAEIRQLGNLTGEQPIVEVDLEDNSERQLREDEVEELKPGRGFARKVRYQRG